MIIAFNIVSGTVRRWNVTGTIPIPLDAVWIDLIDPTPQERLAVENLCGVALPTRDEMHELEISSRLYLERGVTYMAADLIVTQPKRLETHAVAFILTKRQLLTVRFGEFDAFTSFQSRLNPGAIASPDTTLLGLLEAIIVYSGGILRKLASDLESMGQIIFWDVSSEEDRSIRKNIGLKYALSGIGLAGGLASKTQQGLLSVDRLLTFYNEGLKSRSATTFAVRTTSLQRDVISLVEHAEFLSQKTGFLLDATLGFINAEQNQIIKIFSVAAVIFLPPTLVASIYGMNFQFMPELAWSYGYPFAIGLLVLAGIGPYLFFKHKGWI